tara:strand:+ start:375 stop:491 length:117 start_codon:yes stop_codon:yes gene_type:complete
MIDNIVTEIGFVLLGGAVAAVPLYILGLFLRNENDNNI